MNLTYHNKILLNNFSNSKFIRILQIILILNQYKNRKLKMSLTEAIRGQDLFGHKVQLKFDEIENERKSFIGGCVSCFIKVYMAFFIFTNAHKLVMKSSILQFHKSGLDLHKLGDVNFNEAKMTVFYTLSKEVDKTAPITLDNGI